MLKGPRMKRLPTIMNHRHHHFHHHSTDFGNAPSNSSITIIGGVIGSLISVLFCSFFVIMICVFAIPRSSFPIYVFIPFFIAPVIIVGASIFNLIRTIRIAKGMKSDKGSHEIAENDASSNAAAPIGKEQTDKTQSNIVCHRCGYINPPESTFCNQCGSNLREK